jgi:hypothetical protein
MKSFRNGGSMKYAARYTPYADVPAIFHHQKERLKVLLKDVITNPKMGHGSS